MTYLIPTAMITVLTVLFVLLLGIVIWINLKFYQEKKAFTKKVDSLQKKIRESTSKQYGQWGKLQLSEELEKNLIERNASLSAAVFKLNYELFDLLSKIIF